MEPENAALPSFNEDGVDLTLIRWTLSLSVDERLELLQSYLDSIDALRRGNDGG